MSHPHLTPTIDTAFFFRNILNTCKEKQDAGENVLCFDEYPCVLCHLEPTRDDSSSITFLPEGIYWPMMMVNHDEQYITNSQWGVCSSHDIAEYNLDHAIIDEGKRMIRSMLPNIADHEYMYLSHTYDCRCFGRHVVDFIITTTDILDLIQ